MDGQPLTFRPAGRGYRFEGQVATGNLVGMALGRDPLPKRASPGGRDGVYEVPAVAWFAA